MHRTQDLQCTDLGWFSPQSPSRRGQRAASAGRWVDASEVGLLLRALEDRVELGCEHDWSERAGGRCQSVRRGTKRRGRGRRTVAADLELARLRGGNEGQSQCGAQRRVSRVASMVLAVFTESDAP